MASSIKIRDDTKQKLDRLQAEILLKSGIKLSQQDIIEILVSLGSENPEKLVKRDSLSSEAIDEVIDLSSEWSIETDPDMLDDMLLRDED